MEKELRAKLYFLDWAITHAATPAYSCGVNQSPATIFPFNARVNGVAGGATNRTDNGPRFTTDGVQQAGLPHVGAANNRKLNWLLFITLLILGRKKGEHLIEQLSGASTMNRRNRMGFTKTEPPKLRGHA